MRSFRAPVALVVLFTLCFTLFAPVAPAYAFSLGDLFSGNTQNTTSTSSGGSGIFNVLIGLLLGNLLGKFTNQNIASDPAKTLNAKFDNTTNNTNTTGKALIATAKQYMGVPYVWGGSTPTGWDCSGYTQYVMKQNGITIRRTAAEQYEQGTPVSRENLQIGDMVFFTTYKPGASHVGFYMGDGNFIHASSVAKEVTINGLDEQYYKEHYIGARRYTK